MNSEPNENRTQAGSELCVVTGLSGAGKSTALRCFEDLNYFSVDGIPTSLAPQVAAMMRHEQMSHYRGMAIGMDIRQGNFVEQFSSSLEDLASLSLPTKVIFLEAESEALIRRYAATRRPHPLERNGLSLESAIAAERKLLEPLRGMADIVIDSTKFSIHDLRRRIRELTLGQKPLSHTLKINIVSFGYKYGLPNDVDFVFDLRFLPNPYFIDELRPLSGRDKQVSGYIFSHPQANDFKIRLLELLNFTLGQMESEGRYRVTLAFGCTGGRHRSVAMAEEFARILRNGDYPVSVEHRNLNDDLT